MPVLFLDHRRQRTPSPSGLMSRRVPLMLTFLLQLQVNNRNAPEICVTSPNDRPQSSAFN